MKELLFIDKQPIHQHNFKLLIATAIVQKKSFRGFLKCGIRYNEEKACLKRLAVKYLQIYINFLQQYL